ncbi:MAG: TonB C-terminal domain-containing protein [Gammaproteobacteria bacterium]|nr:TonB C-terminal domain-containing protein [Gammaproteobacteria bacterium]MDE2348527.1 TonB C-terminal domain-containing protein [Gammaproteobacteria bacterium]
MTQHSRWRRYIPAGIGALVVLACIAALVWFIQNVLGKKPGAPQREQVQIIKLLPPPPLEQPPPPPPPEKVDQPLPKDVPEPKPAEAPPSQPLGIDAAGTAGTDAFGLAARSGGQDIIGSGNGAFGWYTTIVKNSVLDRLSDDERIRHGSYSVLVRVWVAADGRITKVALARPSGNRDTDEFIVQDLERLPRLSDPPPLEMPQPITLEVASRG